MAHNPFLAGQRTDADRLEALDTQGTYTPALNGATTDPNLGADGVAEGAWWRNGHKITGWARFQFAGTGVDAGSGSYRVGIPFDFDTSFVAVNTPTAAGSIVGEALMFDSSGTMRRIGVVQAFLTNRIAVVTNDGDFIASAHPWTWGDGDRISVSFSYMADSDDLP